MPAIPFRLAASAAALATALLAAGATQARPGDDQTLLDMVQSGSGSYMAGQHASVVRDSAAAATFYSQALRADPRNVELIGQAFVAYTTGGQFDQAVRYAQRLVEIDNQNRLGHLVLGARAMRSRQYDAARTQFGLASHGPVLDLVMPLLGAWATAGTGQTDKAVQAVDLVGGAAGYQAYKDFNAGLMYDLGGQSEKAIARLKAARLVDVGAERVAEALARAQARAGHRDDAMATLKDFDTRLPNHPAIKALMADLQAGRSVRGVVRSAQAGAAEFLVGIAVPLARQGSFDYALTFYQVALYLDSESPPALLGLAGLYDALKQPSNAVAVFDRIPDASPFKHDAEIATAGALDEADQTDQAIQRLVRLTARQPSDSKSLVALGSLYQTHKRFAEAADTYAKAIALVPAPDADDWSLFYFRGISYERTNQWPKAEADFRKALQLSPDQASVLNYLGYSLIDRGLNLQEGLQMVQKAVGQRPDDGFIVDSLGWAYYKLGRFDDAVGALERAVALKPGDPTINDHLGDAYWRDGRKLEATWQWNHARDDKPEADEAAKLDTKLKHGLTAELDAAPQPAAPHATADAAPAPAAPVGKAPETPAAKPSGG